MNVYSQTWSTSYFGNGINKKPNSNNRSNHLKRFKPCRLEWQSCLQFKLSLWYSHLLLRCIKNGSSILELDITLCTPGSSHIRHHHIYTGACSILYLSNTVYLLCFCILLMHARLRIIEASSMVRTQNKIFNQANERGFIGIKCMIKIFLFEKHNCPDFFDS